jgi:hypothetical protein
MVEIWNNVISVILVLILSLGCIQHPTSNQQSTSSLTLPDYTISVGNRVLVEGTVWNKGPQAASNISIFLETKDNERLDQAYFERLEAGEAAKFHLNSSYSKYSKSDFQLIIKVIWGENGKNEIEYLVK